MTQVTWERVQALASDLRARKDRAARCGWAAAAILALEPEDRAEFLRAWFSAVLGDLSHAERVEIACLLTPADDWPVPWVDREMFGRIMEEERQRDARGVQVKHRSAA